MVMLKCSDCAKEFSTKAPACPNCGCPRSFTTASDGSLVPNVGKPIERMGIKTKLFLGSVIAIGGFLALALNAGDTPEARERGSARSAIQLCWDDQKRKSFEPSTQRFVAQVCEKMEDDFYKKYNVRP